MPYGPDFVHLDLSKLFWVACDVFKVGIGSILSQEG